VANRPQRHPVPSTYAESYEAVLCPRARVNDVQQLLALERLKEVIESSVSNTKLSNRISCTAVAITTGMPDDDPGAR
jgi:hypothetical protein